MAIAYIALGSNLGDRLQYLQSALAHLKQAGVAVERVSKMYETAPIGGPPGQGPYLNAAARLHTDLAPRALLDFLLETERRLGRVRDVYHGPRTVDLDLLLYDDQVLRAPGLELPHPRLHERWFVLAPLAEIAADVMHPLLHRTIGELLSAVSKPEQSGAASLAHESWKVQEAM